MKINKDIILKLLFEEHRVTLATMELEEFLGDKVLSIDGICVHGTDLFEIVLQILEFQKLENHQEFDYYYTPFLKIYTSTFENAKAVKAQIEIAYDWLVVQVGEKPPENLKPPVFF